jgi:YVTN family beta-propeller protein
VEYVTGAAAVALIAAIIPAGTGELGHLPGPAGQGHGATVYVVHQHGQGTGTVVPISAATNEPGTPIKVGLAPDFIAMTPDGKTAYVANGFSGTVTPITTATGTPGKPIKVGPQPDFIAITPDGKTAYVASAGTSGLCLKPPCPPPIPASVTPISTATNTPGKPIRVRTDQIVITPDGRTAYAVTWDGVVPISTSTNTPGPLIRGAYQPYALAITPDSKTAYVSHPRGVTPISTATNNTGKPIQAGYGPGPLAITPDGKTAYVAIDGNSRAIASFVTPISTATNKPGAPIPLRGTGGLGAGNSQALQVAITPDGRTAYVDIAVRNRRAPHNFYDAVIPISTATNTAGKPIRVGSPGIPLGGSLFHAGFIVFTPDAKTAYVASTNAVIPISTATNTAGNPIPVGPGEVGPMAITP